MFEWIYIVCRPWLTRWQGLRSYRHFNPKWHRAADVSPDNRATVEASCQVRDLSVSLHLSVCCRITGMTPWWMSCYRGVAHCGGGGLSAKLGDVTVMNGAVKELEHKWSFVMISYFGRSPAAPQTVHSINLPWLGFSTPAPSSWLA